MRYVLDAFAAPPGSELHEWATAMGTDFRRAWRECPTGVWLMRLAHYLGVPGAELTALFKSSFQDGEEQRIVDAWQAGPRDPTSSGFAKATLASGVDHEAMDRRLAERIRARFDIEVLLGDVGS